MSAIIELRGEIIEARHPWSAVLVARDGTIRRLGDELVTSWRSAAKPLQLTCALELLAGHDFSESELAVGAASHSGQPRHLALVEALLARYRIEPSLLRCGAHPPIHQSSADEILRGGSTFSDLHNNCSGKHSFMLIASQVNGWDLDYRPPHHPLQQLIRQRIVEWTGAEPLHAVDGCGVPTFGLPISAMARAWQKLALAMCEAPESDLGRVGWAMARNPLLTSGDERLDAAIVQHAREPLAVKIGARAVFCLAFPQRRCAVVVKVHSGDSDALAIAVPAALQQLVPGAFSLPEDWPWSTIRNVVGLAVGRRVLKPASTGP